MKQRQQNKVHIKNHASKKLRTNLRILAVVYVVLLLATAITSIRSGTALWQDILGFAIGVGAGLISSRMYKITWDHHEAEVVGKIDIYGFIVLVLFIIFEFNRSYIAGIFAPSEAIGTISLTLVTGALYGRFIGTDRKIIHTLRSEGIIKLRK